MTNSTKPTEPLERTVGLRITDNECRQLDNLTVKFYRSRAYLARLALQEFLAKYEVNDGI
jgi:predicted transcriptional regulator